MEAVRAAPARSGLLQSCWLNRHNAPNVSVASADRLARSQPHPLSYSLVALIILPSKSPKRRENLCVWQSKALGHKHDTILYARALTLYQLYCVKVLGLRTTAWH